MKQVCLTIFACVISCLPVGAQWLTDSEEAFQLAAETQKPVLLVFSGSDWCKPCIKMDQEVFQADSFQAYADSSLILLKADFPRSRKNRLSETQMMQNETLASEWNAEGSFPKIILISPDQEILYESGYVPGGPVTFISIIRQVQHESH